MARGRRVLFALLAGLSALPACRSLADKKAEPQESKVSPLDYDQAIPLDAEDLAEGGVAAAYQLLLPHLHKYAAHPMSVEERFDPNGVDYGVTAGGREYVISGRGLAEEGSWGRATTALFTIVNRQLEQSERRLYALNSGNDLFGILLTPSEAETARRALANKRDWPYLPKQEPPWFGQFH